MASLSPDQARKQLNLYLWLGLAVAILGVVFLVAGQAPPDPTTGEDYGPQGLGIALGAFVFAAGQLMMLVAVIGHGVRLGLAYAGGRASEELRPRGMSCC